MDSVTKLQDEISDLGTILDIMWILLNGIFVFFMQLGFCQLETGTCRSRAIGTTLMKNLIDMCQSAIIWSFGGHILADKFVFGDAQVNGWLVANIDDQDDDTDMAGHWARWFGAWVFCATATTIVSGAVLERIRFKGYLIYGSFMTGIIYPVVAFCSWNEHGFLKQMGFSDFAGSGVVHLTGGMGALVGAIAVGHRLGRYTEDSNKFKPHNIAMVVSGTMILWFGWYGFNCGSTGGISTLGQAKQVGLIAWNTTLSAIAGGLTSFFLRARVEVEGAVAVRPQGKLCGCTGGCSCDKCFVDMTSGKPDILDTCNGVLAGLVASCAGVHDYDPFVAAIVGVVGAGATTLAQRLLAKAKIDDALSAFPVHGAAGIVGLLLRPLGKQGDMRMFGANLAGTLLIILWSGGISVIVFGLLQRTGWLTLTIEEQKSGTDKTLIFEMGGDKDFSADSLCDPPVAPDPESEVTGGDVTQLDARKPDGETSPPAPTASV
eukprot:gnl/TRDRNA2_/TRDRNA2_37640_c0_seq1.p1 gnl/TRDRNA2_/TRDRNA2_37640_c0~~gnl/TRDRNA2_/TRDRNA2_37640_c0_seq1.p1  ORF type:complete len:511 (+),score=65.20 gnl/TRDRNA2_/TRDRNA2_37640_c0_seq1:67-1533(+)